MGEENLGVSPMSAEDLLAHKERVGYQNKAKSWSWWSGAQGFRATLKYERRPHD